MGVIAVPRGERSGSHRVVDVEVGDLREVIAALAGVATLARASGVGPRALRESLPELRASCIASPAIVANALLPACDVVALSTGLAAEAHRAVDDLVAATRAAAARVHEVMDAIERKGLGARTRLALQATCDRTAQELAHVRAAVELLQRASTSEPLPVAIEDVLRELDSGERDGTHVELTVGGALDSSVAVQPRVASAVVLGALGRLHALSPAPAFVAHAVDEGSRLVVEIRRRVATIVDPRFTVDVLVPHPAPFDAGVLRLAAATLAAPLEVSADRVRLELLRV